MRLLDREIDMNVKKQLKNHIDLIEAEAKVLRLKGRDKEADNLDAIAERFLAVLSRIKLKAA
jgi:hypothetical protein